MTRKTIKLKFEMWVSKAWALILVSPLIVDSGFTLKYPNVSTTEVKSSSQTSKPSILLIDWVRHTSINLHFFLPCSYFFMKFCKCFARIGQKFQKYEMSLITSIKLRTDEILHDVPITRCNLWLHNVYKEPYHSPSTTSSSAHLFAIRGRRKRGPGTLQTRDQNLSR